MLYKASPRAAFVEEVTELGIRFKKSYNLHPNFPQKEVERPVSPALHFNIKGSVCSRGRY